MSIILNGYSKIVLLSLFILFGSMTSLTVASYIESEIIPISINKKGEVLCKTRFTKNEEDADCPMKVEYGFCIIAIDTIIQFKTKVIDPDKFANWNIYYEQQDYWDAIFRAKTELKQLKVIEKVVLENKYSFTLCNADSFWVEKIVPVSEFEAVQKISLKKNPQKALNGVLSTKHYKVEKVHLQYDFGKILILNNWGKIDGSRIGADFNYYNPWTNNKGQKVNRAFDVFNITGILIIK